MHFLDDRGARGSLFARRPDLGEIELSCENTNTPLPLIDLVNEVLEDAAATPSAFSPFALAAALETDLNVSPATPALSAAFTPALATGSVVEVVEPGARWRIWDQAFAYTIVKKTGALTVTARSRQTSGTAAERRATPQFRNAAAYQQLAAAVFPWTLPFDLPSAEAGTFLAHLGVSRGELIAALRLPPGPVNQASPTALSLAAEGLGLTDTERKISRRCPGPAAAARGVLGRGRGGGSCHRSGGARPQRAFLRGSRRPGRDPLGQSRGNRGNRPGSGRAHLLRSG